MTVFYREVWMHEVELQNVLGELQSSGYAIVSVTPFCVSGDAEFSYGIVYKRTWRVTLRKLWRYLVWRSKGHYRVHDDIPF